MSCAAREILVVELFEELRKYRAVLSNLLFKNTKVFGANTVVELMTNYNTMAIAFRNTWVFRRIGSMKAIQDDQISC